MYSFSFFQYYSHANSDCQSVFLFTTKTEIFIFLREDAVVNIKGQGLAPQITIKDLIEAGSHFGHQTRRWNPKMRVYIFGERNNIHIIDLAKTLKQINIACDFVKEIVSKRKSILFVGTKKAAKEIVKEEAERAGEFYAVERWLGGMLTNLTTIRQSVKKMERIEKRIAAGGDGLTKKEISEMSKLQIKLEKNLSGIRGMRKPPGLIVVVDPGHEDIAIKEAKKLGIPVMALVDTNCDPDPIDLVIPCNDDAQRSIKLVLETLVNTIIEKKNEMKVAEEKDDDEDSEEEALQQALEKAMDMVEEGEGKND